MGAMINDTHTHAPRRNDESKYALYPFLSFHLKFSSILFYHTFRGETMHEDSGLLGAVCNVITVWGGYHREGPKIAGPRNRGGRSV